MRYLLPLAFAITANSALAAPASLSIKVDGIENGKPVPAEHALCIPTKDGKSEPGKNLRPMISWSGAPAGTESYAVFMMDPDVPADFTDKDQEGKTIAADAKRQDFFHFGVVNIPATASALNGGPSDKAPKFGDVLVNSLGDYVSKPGAFGGPCPPWNDARLHHYHFIVLALGKDAPIAGGAKNKTAPSDDAKAVYTRLAHSKALLAKGEVVGTYSLNPAVK